MIYLGFVRSIRSDKESDLRL